MRDQADMQRLARLLRLEWEGHGIDRRELRDLARRLLPLNPDMRCTLTSIDNRLSQV
ncbi:hypothetical protein [Magnetospirillum gryphiswaldense]|uniref:Uncharacterized protein n=1 Tax=Magnetospirillum gryphiswaldense TaxID=55518 RepID=A4TU19_9PROT|nr:hypothetical protein [Magnetospirillum gryphiswaldense]AVM74339.1 hypothetical protein MSR1_18480 [Magnetospirillum gryphiswaldense MSR-1]AVM78242.1 hypothetical protein MSR1L_18480 [Magnetospirillum gryphiswaldense]CAM74126.1 hypothetical protein MGR_1083 [Magnetospirillum gryphiswaldense MSR-1]